MAINWGIFRHTIETDWQIQDDDATVHCMVVGRFSLFVFDKDDYASWSVEFRGYILEEGTSNNTVDARANAESALLEYIS